MPTIHPTAVVDPAAELGEDVRIGPYCLVERGVRIGPRTVLRSHVIVRPGTTLGADNLVDPGCVLGGEPQDLKFDPATDSGLTIGDGNVFRECVTISRASKPGGATVVGNRTYWMAYSHAGHDATIQDGAILVNGAAIGGHCTVGARAFLSAHVVVHQFCWIGRLVITEGNGSIRSHVPPYTMTVGRNRMVGLNVVGLRRAAELTADDRQQIKEVFRLTYRSGLSPAQAAEKMEAMDLAPPADEFRQFVRKCLKATKPFDRGLIPTRARLGDEEGE